MLEELAGEGSLCLTRIGSARNWGDKLHPPELLFLVCLSRRVSRDSSFYIANETDWHRGIIEEGYHDRHD